ncbi:MAG: substrate-binding domain-containing protein [Fusobacteriaceae bacterium]|nr:substrate-binding domain-containing protein [Fusobacteriaceae bacterium]
MKRVLTLCAGILLVSALAFASGKKKLGIVMPAATHGFTGESIKAAQKGAETFSKQMNFDYQFLTANESSEQNNQIDTLLNSKVDAIVLWPLNGNELRSAAMKITEAKIPLVIYDRLIENFKPTVEVMGDNFTIGEKAGAYFSAYFAEELKKGKVNLLEFKGDNSTVPQQRTDGFLKTADKNLVFFQAFSTDWQRQKAREQMESFLINGKKEDVESIRGIFTHDDEVVLGLLDAIAAYDGNKKINIKLISGVQANKDFFAALEAYKGKIDLMTYSFSPVMVRDAVKIGGEILNGKKYDGLVLLPTTEVDAKNYKEYMNSEEYKLRYED